MKKFLKLTKEELLDERKKVIKENIILSLNKFCTPNNGGITKTQLLKMKGLRSLTSINFPEANINEIGRCLDEMYKTNEENKKNVTTFKMIGCAGISMAIGGLTFYTGGTLGIATAVGLGCFGYETSITYEKIQTKL